MINPFKKAYTLQEQNTFVFLANIKLFSELNHKQMSLFLPHMHIRTYEKDEIVFFRGDPSHALYLLKKGTVSLDIDMAGNFENLTSIKSGTALGESCLLKDANRLLNAYVTSEQAEFYVIPQDNIFDIFESSPKIKLKMLESLAEMYNSYNMNLFNAYQASRGFFNLRQVYQTEG
ncbi:Crp/Fnr family transcriptional regulator [Fulvivirga sp. M361]|uniref:Crp/Fnr family transcriptional regulator n=1 Tax=Fulvivirga sp. M361 TaxID=2594266 RepID=UPI0016289C45|nr:cyclic nucleotide-binding domain-containing protein [Fulvivirga sp. M361]